MNGECGTYMSLLIKAVVTCNFVLEENWTFHTEFTTGTIRMNSKIDSMVVRTTQRAT